MKVSNFLVAKIMRAGRRYGVECKRMDAPRLTPSMRMAISDLKLDHLTVVYPGAKPYPLSDKVSVLPLSALAAGATSALTGR